MSDILEGLRGIIVEALGDDGKTSYQSDQFTVYQTKLGWRLSFFDFKGGLSDVKISEVIKATDELKACQTLMKRLESGWYNE